MGDSPEVPTSIRLTTTEFAAMFKSCHGVIEVEGRVVADEAAIKNGAWRGFNWSTVRIDAKRDHLVVIQSLGTIETDPKTGEMIFTPSDNLLSQLLFRHIMEGKRVVAQPKEGLVHAQAPA